MELLERAQSWFATPMPKGDKTGYFKTLNELYFEITGQRVQCTSCNYYSMRSRIESFLNNPIPITKTTIMKATKYSFTKEAINNKISIILHLDNGATKAVNADNLTDADAEAILNNKGLKAAYGHNIQALKAEEAPKVTAKKETKATDSAE